MRARVLAALAGVLLLAPAGASAAPIAPTLASLILNVDGATYDSLVDGAIPGSLGGATVDASGFDIATGLGILRFQLTGAGPHTVLGFFDIDLREDQDFTNDTATSDGAPVAGQSWEIDIPEGDVIDHSFNTTAATGSLLSNSNDLSGPDDVSLALAWDFILNAGDVAFIDFVGSDVDFGTIAGFRLLASDQSSVNAYGLSSALRVVPGQEPTPVPEPGTLLLLGAGCVGIAPMLRRYHS